jgi:hypothetical protein
MPFCCRGADSAGSNRRELESEFESDSDVESEVEVDAVIAKDVNPGCECCDPMPRARAEDSNCLASVYSTVYRVGIHHTVRNSAAIVGPASMIPVLWLFLLLFL